MKWWLGVLMYVAISALPLWGFVFNVFLTE